ncbi:hypothetical protein [Alteribacillus iranensis]|uniref:Uncharacterized protein n=1 Tax=Alteribacillus iranensis TaxID=930128 RepID=A0A1I2FAA8_9BACI|nr:hypothetical protein [Alteribacillus iranensis]SFF01859.1 hypothetical protein SAMN05192532_11012 [Alteribacillus iranensis]
MERNTYYIQMHPNMMRITNVKLDDNTIQYGVRATPEEKLELEKRMDEVQRDDASPSLLLERVHDEYLEEDAKAGLNMETKQLFQKIYELGTPETKKFLEEQGMATF